MLREFRVMANVGKPQVAYRETITQPALSEGEFLRQMGGRNQYGRVVLELEPLPAHPGRTGNLRRPWPDGPLAPGNGYFRTNSRLARSQHYP